MDSFKRFAQDLLDVMPADLLARLAEIEREQEAD